MSQQGKKMAEDFIIECVKNLGLGFHPDESFENYIEHKDKSRVYTDEEAKRMNRLMRQAIRLLGNEGMYEIAYREQQALIAEIDRVTRIERTFGINHHSGSGCCESHPAAHTCGTDEVAQGCEVEGCDAPLLAMKESE